jgi:hypothetical protein
MWETAAERARILALEQNSYTYIYDPQIILDEVCDEPKKDISLVKKYSMGTFKFSNV